MEATHVSLVCIRIDAQNAALKVVWHKENILVQVLGFVSRVLFNPSLNQVPICKYYNGAIV